MPKKKKGKETATPEFKFDYRYTPKPYFTAPTTCSSSPISRSAGTKSSQLLRPRGNPNPDAWQAQKQRSYNYTNNRGLTYAKAATTSSSGKTASASRAASAIEVMVSSADADTPVSSQKDQTAIKKSFEEMFRGRVDSSVIEVVLQNVSWNENEALDILSQMAPEDTSHLHNILNKPDTASATWFGAVTPDHNLTPTAPTLSYSSSITSLDEYGAEFTRDVTQRNLSQVADVLRNGPDDINDLDRQRLARSRATTPRSLLRNNAMTIKNISLGSTESLESNRSHYSHDPSGITYACASPGLQGTPKKTNFEKTVSLHDISTADDIGLVMSLPRDQASELETTRSDPGTIESFLIPLKDGDIVLEKGTYDLELNGASGDTATPQPQSSAGPLSHSASISDYTQAFTSLISQLHTDEAKGGGSAAKKAVDEQTSDDAAGAAAAGAVAAGAAAAVTETETSNSGEAVSTVSYSEKLSALASKDSQYPYDGLLGSGVAVPTAFESARPKKAKVVEVDEATRPLQQTARSGEKVTFILRGAPGSGKSTLARKLIAETDGRSFSTDEYFVDETGEYNCQPHLLPEAHAWNQDRVHEAMKSGVTPVVVDNTNLEVFEMEFYVKISLQYGYRPILAEPSTAWRYKAKELFKRNTHHVPFAKIKQMLERFDHRVTVNQLMDIVISKQPKLQSMADQMKATSAKLSRRKPTSKTIKRNQQHATIEKFKDKKVDELISSPSTSQQRMSQSPTPKQQPLSVSEDEDNSSETAIMYPNAASLNALKRNATIKVLNCDKPKLTVSKKAADDSKVQKSTDSTASDVSTDKPNMKPKHKHSKSDCDVNPQASTDLVRAEKTTDLSKTVDLAPEETVTKHENKITLLPPATDLSGGLSIDKSVSVDTGLSRTGKDQSQTSTHIKDQSNQEDADEELVIGSSTLPRVSARGSVEDPIMSQSASLPRSKEKNKSSKKSTGKKASGGSVLAANSAQMERWLSNNWAAPPYPAPSTSDVTMSRSVPSSLMNSSASSTAVTSSVNAMTSSLTSSIDPPPPYEEHDRGAAVNEETLRFEVKKKDGCTLTEPVDYAMAYKAMQHNHQLPQGWLLISGRSKPPHPLPVGAAAHNSSLVTHDKGTMIAEDDLSMSRSPSQDDLAPKTDGLEKLQSCFPQLSKEQLAEFLELCRGDSTWATNLLLDSNKVPLAKKSKRQATSTMSIAGLNKRMVSKYKVGKLALAKKFGKAIVPVSDCLGKLDQPPYTSLSSPQTISLQLTNEQASNLHALFGRGQACPSSMANGEVKVDVPRWIAHKIYMCMVDNSKEDSPSQSPRLSTETLVTPKRPPRRRRTAPSAVPVIADSKEESELAASGAGADITAASADFTFDEEVGPPSYSQEDEELARRLQTEDLMDVIKSRQQTPAQKFSLIADEEFARSLMVAEINGGKAEPDLSAKLKRQKLYELHPGLDKSFLDEVFKSSGYHLEQTLQFLSDHHGSDPLPVVANGSSAHQMVISSAGDDFSDSKEQSAGTRESSPAKHSFTDGEDQWFDVEDYMANADYQDFRAEANLHQKLRKECLEKAAMANSKRKYGVSTHYADQAEHHWQKWKDANMAAATQIFKSSNSHRSKDEVDLHGLHPDEAVCAVSEIIKLAKEEGKYKHLSIITGRGNRSKSGVARVKKAVECFLDKNRMIYRMENPGMIKVTL